MTKTSPKTAAQLRLRALIAETEAKLADLEILPTLDEYPHGQIVRVVVRPRYDTDNADKEFAYAFIKQAVRSDDERWHPTATLWGYKPGLANPTGWVTYEQIVEWSVHHVKILAWEPMVSI